MVKKNGLKEVKLKLNEGLHIGDDVTIFAIEVTKQGGNQKLVKFAITTPKDISIDRAENRKTLGNR